MVVGPIYPHLMSTSEDHLAFSILSPPNLGNPIEEERIPLDRATCSTSTVIRKGGELSTSRLDHFKLKPYPLKALTNSKPAPRDQIVLPRPLLMRKQARKRLKSLGIRNVALILGREDSVVTESSSCSLSMASRALEDLSSIEDDDSEGEQF
ncbi:hypothetical protein BHM03_00019362 [Ensete ventricosum]|nr:hypothetical protein BHM03_00019362 [Ensete ventricosum]